MSEVTTLKQLMLDAARYRWLRDRRLVIKFYDANWEILTETWGGMSGVNLDEIIDEELNRE